MIPTVVLTHAIAAIAGAAVWHVWLRRVEGVLTQWEATIQADLARLTGTVAAKPPAPAPAPAPASGTTGSVPLAAPPATAHAQ